MADDRFWDYLDEALATYEIVIDRPKGSRHPRYPEIVYPLDYGYLEGTASGNGGGIDLWVGSRYDGALTGVVCTYDAVKGDMEVKLLLGCTPDERATVLTFHDCGQMAALLIERPIPETGSDADA